ncbi:MAG: hypothetical protein H6Q69_292 [Firmicutes bacterium]|nr:hypothetical protein [Bacillota bacterium]
MKKVFIVFLMLMYIPVIALCSTTKVLDKDTELQPQGWTAGTLKFKQGGTVELNEQGQVISGILKSFSQLRPVASAFSHALITARIGNIFFQSDYNVTFDEHGHVLSGILGTDSDVCLSPNTEPYVGFKYNTAILFDKDGNLIKGTICDDTLLRPIGWKNYLPIDNNAGLIKFKAGTEVVLGANAQVIKGTIANDLTVNGITYPAGTTLQFSESAIPQKI